MLADFQHQYATLSDDQLLHVAADRQSLIEEAKSALDAELQRRHLTAADLFQHEKSVILAENRGARRTKRKLVGNARDRRKWVDNVVFLFWYVVTLSLISMAYLALPARFRFSPRWQETATYVMFSSVFVVVAGREWWRRTGLWMALVISSTAHTLIVHAWIVRKGTKVDFLPAILLGPILFLVVCVCGYLVRKKSNSEEVVAKP